MGLGVVKGTLSRSLDFNREPERTTEGGGLISYGCGYQFLSPVQIVGR